jgi:cytidine deaminase
MDQLSSEIKQAYELALQTRLKAHAPYSQFLVGAVIKFKGQDKSFIGCNVENASYGATICAERNAIFSAIAENGKQNIEWVVVVADTERATVPCALCLQVMNEFQDTDFPVYLGNLNKILEKFNYYELLPYRFDTL